MRTDSGTVNAERPNEEAVLDITLPADGLQECEGKCFPTRYLRFEDFCLDLQWQAVSRNGVRIRLAGKTYEALTALLENPGQIVSREELRTRLWPEKTLGYESNLNITVSKLRQALGGLGDGTKLIETVPRKGYVLIANVEHLDRPATISSAPRKVEPSLQEPVCTAASWSVIGASHGRVLFATGVISLVVASMLLGAAITRRQRKFPALCASLRGVPRPREHDNADSSDCNGKR